MLRNAARAAASRPFRSLTTLFTECSRVAYPSPREHITTAGDGKEPSHFTAAEPIAPQVRSRPQSDDPNKGASDSRARTQSSARSMRGVRLELPISHSTLDRPPTHQGSRTSTGQFHCQSLCLGCTSFQPRLQYFSSDEGMSARDACMASTASAGALAAGRD